MDFSTILNVVQVLVLPVVGLIAYFIKRLIERLDSMERDLANFITHQEARTLVEDMQKPLEVSLKNVEYLLNRILNELEKKH